ncbi:C-GCAxxG-C-C family protein [Halothermothrix orenii]|uniref:Split soret cytochrome c n=1 Tax=Halothermothrix orenii (strain H 168 / OCM 544 / DSM 9562) TaxID=373903 RepID=B8D1R4_HALOH|nr:C-GCAxxG-C-C family protein [Halothermothrix orenii]ACL69141.1 split soret cytochrome c precursor [Halothermothrix orenii H 168]
MEEKNNKISRKQFLTTVGGLAAGAVLAGSGLSLLDSEVKAEKLPEYPWTKYFAKKLNVETVRKKATQYYHEGNHCAEASFRALVEELGAPFSNVPSQVLWFGAGGGAGWATLCGAVNGGSAAISLVYGRSKITMALVNELFGWYSETPLPLNSEVNSVAGTPLCHSSVSNWCEASGLKADSKKRSKRCGLLTGDTTAKAAELLNAQLAGKFVATYTIPKEAQECMNCHVAGDLKDTRGKMDCLDCHEGH